MQLDRSPCPGSSSARRGARLLLPLTCAHVTSASEASRYGASARPKLQGTVFLSQLCPVPSPAQGMEPEGAGTERRSPLRHRSCCGWNCHLGDRPGPQLGPCPHRGRGLGSFSLNPWPTFKPSGPPCSPDLPGPGDAKGPEPGMFLQGPRGLEPHTGCCSLPCPAAGPPRAPFPLRPEPLWNLVRVHRDGGVLEGHSAWPHPGSCPDPLLRGAWQARPCGGQEAPHTWT